MIGAISCGRRKVWRTERAAERGDDARVDAQAVDHGSVTGGYGSAVGGTGSPRRPPRAASSPSRW